MRLMSLNIVLASPFDSSPSQINTFDAFRYTSGIIRTC